MKTDANGRNGRKTGVFRNFPYTRISSGEVPEKGTLTSVASVCVREYRKTATRRPIYNFRRTMLLCKFGVAGR